MKHISAGYLPLAFMLLTVYTVCSCTPEACLDETASSVKALFLLTGDGKLDAPDSLTLYGIGKDTVRIYSKSANIQPAKIPLDASTDTSRFVIKINGETDTILFSYTSYPHLVSKTCGFTYFHSLGSLIFTRNGIDTIIVINRNISTANEENIRIFY